MTTDLGTARLVVDVDVVVLRDDGEERFRARHAWCGTDVHVVSSSAPASTVGTSTFDVADWQAELAGACRVTAPCSTSPGPAPGLEVPWDLVLGTGSALRHHRADLYDVLVARADGAVAASGRPLGTDAVHTQIRRLHHAVVGRLRCVGTVPSTRRVGWVSWLLYPDGWLALTPYVGAVGEGSRVMVRLEPRRPDDLAHEVARWAVAR